jgi:hypothetical protein
MGDWSFDVRVRPGDAMSRIVHRIIMAVLLAAALAVIWHVLGGR